jgi:hypothetical protein
MVAFFPPSSAITGLGFVLADSLINLYPTSLDPVNTMPATSLLSMIALPISTPEPGTKFTTPLGSPASIIISTIL